MNLDQAWEVKLFSLGLSNIQLNKSKLGGLPEGSRNAFENAFDVFEQDLAEATKVIVAAGKAAHERRKARNPRFVAPRSEEDQ